MIKNLDPTIEKIKKMMNPDEAFWIANFSRVRECLTIWKKHLPDISIHYAVKCCDEPQLLEFLAEEGVGFDCASKNEFERIINLNVSAERIVFSHPLKSIEALQYAKNVGVKRLVYDSIDELHKIMEYYPDAEVFLRIKPLFSNAKIQLSNKFGVTPDQVDELINEAVKLKANFIGFSFHVGSQCDDPESFRGALKYVRELKDKAESKGIRCKFVDIGGGFFSPNSPARNSFGKIGDIISDTIREDFEDYEKMEFIGEPGRFIATEYLDLHLPVIGKRVIKNEKGELVQMIFIPDGIYGAFNAIKYDHATPHFDIFTKNSPNNLMPTKLVHTTLWGQTCDSMDVVYEDLMWPYLEVGDLIGVKKFGAYTYSPTSFFNGFHHHKVVPINR